MGLRGVRGGEGGEGEEGSGDFIAEELHKGLSGDVRSLYPGGKEGRA